jgi:hypothetical protein
MTAKDKKTGLYALKPGDRVQVTDVNGPRMGQPKGGWDGTVAKVGRTLIHVNYPGGHYNRPTAFRLDDGRANDDYGHQHVWTVEEMAERTRRSELTERLREYGIQFDHRSRTEHSIETLAALAAVLDAAAETPKD